MATLGPICFGEPELQNADFQVQFSHQRIEVNSALCKRTSDKRIEILRQFATVL
jgi:hypothetical protein